MGRRSPAESAARGQTYFAYQARRTEIVDLMALSERSEELKRDVLRFLLYTYDLKLQKAAQETRAVEPGDFAIFFNHGYIGLLE